LGLEYTYGATTIYRADSINELLTAALPKAASSAQPSEIECAVLELFEEFRNPLLRYVLSFGVSVHDAEEVTQEVFLSLFRHLQLEKSRRNLRGWLFRVAHNLALKKRYANQRAHQSASLDWAVAEMQSDPSPNPEEQLSFLQRRQRLLAVLSVLPETDQCCLRLRAEGLRYREISSILGISLGAVSISLTRSLARLLRADGS
jgi:RNA polymerase sigma-70 factor (ECF subfamily)